MLFLSSGVLHIHMPRQGVVAKAVRKPWEGSQLIPGAWALPTPPALPCSAWSGSWDGAASCQKVLIVV